MVFPLDPEVFGMVFAASNIARLLLPLRFGAALAMAPWVDENIMRRGGRRGGASLGAPERWSFPREK